MLEIKKIIILCWIGIAMMLSLSSCTDLPKDEDEYPYLWKSNIEDNDTTTYYTTYGFFFKYPVYNNTVVVAGKKGPHTMLYGFDINSGKKKWELIHKKPSYEGFMLHKNICVKDGYWYFAQRDYLYKININTGEKEELKLNLPTDTRFLLDDIDNRLAGWFFRRGTNDVYYAKYDAQLSNIVFKKIPEVNHQTKHPHANNPESYYNLFSVEPFINSKGDVCVFIEFDDVHPFDNTNSVQKVSMYNITQEKYIYDGIELLQTPSNNYNIENDSLFVHFFVGDYVGNIARTFKMFGVNINTGELIWLKDLSKGSRAVEVIDDKIYEFSDLDAKLSIYNKKDGKLLVQKNADAGIWNNMTKYQDLIYFMEQGTKLRAIDPVTGEYKLKLSSPERAPYNSWGFAFAIENDKIIVDNYKNVYAYPALK